MLDFQVKPAKILLDNKKVRGAAVYIKRQIEGSIDKAAKMFGAVMLTGPRQAGKTTLLKTIVEGIPYLSLDDPILLQSAVEQAGTFFKSTQPPVIIDEIQYAPNLFPYIKMYLDEGKKKGQFYLSGSQQFRMMKNVSESLAGRIGILNLLGLSMREIYNISFSNPFAPTTEYLSERRKEIKNIGYQEVWGTIHRGSMPEMYANRDFDWQLFYGSYTKTYIERDVRELTQIGDELKFLRFMAVIAASTGQVVNLASVSREVGISQSTTERWLSILQSANIVYLLPPYFNNITKRAIKKPKLYFMDTGLAAYLTRWNNAEVLEKGAMAGAFFETFIVAEIIKSYYNAGILEPPLYYYRDKEHNEIDLLIADGNTFYPIEIKKHSDPSKHDTASFRLLEKIPGINRGPGAVVCLYDRLIPLDAENMIIPVNYL